MKNDNMLISVMIPTYNQEHFIAQAVDGILRQDYENIEVIISDDCSTDGTFEKIKPFLDDPRVRYYKNNITIGSTENYKKPCTNEHTEIGLLTSMAMIFLPSAIISRMR